MRRIAGLLLLALSLAGQAPLPELVAQTAHPDAIAALALSQDGLLVATVGRGSSAIRIWQVSTGFELRTLDPQAGRVRTLAFSPDRRRLAVALDDDATLRLYDVASGGEIQQFHACVDELHFSRDGRWLAAIANRADCFGRNAFAARRCPARGQCQAGRVRRRRARPADETPRRRNARRRRLRRRGRAAASA